MATYTLQGHASIMDYNHLSYDTRQYIAEKLYNDFELEIMAVTNTTSCTAPIFRLNCAETRQYNDLFTAHFIKLLKTFFNKSFAITASRLYSKTTMAGIADSCIALKNSVQSFYETLPTSEEAWTINIIIKNNLSQRLAKTTLTNYLGATIDPALTNFINKTNPISHVGYDATNPNRWFIVANDVTLNDLRAVIATIALRLVKQTLTGKPQEDFIKYMEPLAEPYLKGDLDKYITNTQELYKALKKTNDPETIINAVVQFIQKERETKINNIQQDINNYNRQLQNLEAEYTGTLKRLKDKHTTLAGVLTNNDTEKYKETIIRILKYPTVKHIATRDNAILVTVESPVTNYIQTDLNRILTDRNTCDHYRIDNKMKTVLINTFIDKKYTLICCNTLKINTAQLEYNASTPNPSAIVGNNIYPNPHLRKHNCFGNNAPALRKAVLECDFLTIVHIFLAAVNNINFVDSTVFSGFIRDLNSNYADRKIFKNNKTNEMLTYNEVYNEIMAEKDANSNTNNKEGETQCPEN